jgi:glycosyltransferase 2 family protein
MSPKQILTYVISLGIGVVLFYLAFSIVDDKEALWDNMRSVRWEGIAASFVMGYLAIVSRGLRWGILLEPLGRSAGAARSVHAVAFAYFANTFVPRSGELARCAALNQTDDIPVDELFGTVISERVIDFVFLAVLTSIAILGNLSAFAVILEGAQMPDLSKLILLGAAALVAIALVFWKRKALLALPFAQKVAAFLQGVWNGLNSIRKMNRKGQFLAHTFFIWFTYFFMAWVIFKSFDAVQDITVLQALFIMVAGGFGMVIPAPGGVGSYQWAVMSGFMALGYAKSLGLAVANIIWFTQTAMIVIMGGIAYLYLLWYRLRKDRG